MSKMPWIRFFPSDWLAGTRGMSAVETGVYITLIATMYERGEPIQEDHARLSRLCGASNSAFKKALETLVDEGKIRRVDAGLWNDRVEKEQVYLSEKSEVGSRAANARWGKKDKENNAGDDANALPVQSEGNANQKPEARTISSSLRSEESARSVKANLQAEFEHQVWPIYPHKVGKPVAVQSFIKARSKASFETIFDGLKRYVAKTDDRAWCNLSTWLNQERWNDRPAAPVPRGHSPPSTGSGNAMVDRLDQLMAGMEQRNANGPTIETSDFYRDVDRSPQAVLGFAPSGRIIEGR